ncbi:MAG: hypothetical protein J5528_06825 [Firmicutes bacterium]|nr:hypothetical protein [Bacillota bacterium]
MKKIFVAVVLCLALVLSAVPSAVFATKSGLEFTATVNPEKLAPSSDDQTVTVTINADKTMQLDAVGAFIYFKSGEYSFPVQSVSNTDISGFGFDDPSEALPDCYCVYWTNDFSTVDYYETSNLMVITLTVPGGTPAGTYTLKVAGDAEGKGIYLSNNYGTTLEDEAVVTFDIVIEAPEVPQATIPTAAENLTYTGENQTGVPAGEGYTITGNTATNAGDYTAVATLEEGYVWEDGSTDPKEIPWSIAKAVIDSPAAATGLEYTGEEQTGVEAGEGYTVTGNTATDAGDYTAKATADANHTFAEGDSVDVPWSIAKAVIEAPKAVEGLEYTGEEQTGVPEGEGYTIEGNTATEAGDYTATLTADKNHTFAEGDTVTVDWKIAPASEHDDEEEKASVGATGSIAPEDLGEGAQVSYEVEENDGVIEFNEETGEYTALKEGTATVHVFYSNSANYGRGDYVVTITITNAAPTGDMTARWIMVGAAALVVMGVYLFISKRKEQE